ncbi:hypothetical protein J7L00_06660 [Candidatus Bathyarchaeota archaeon]|nr:hypothetical protein [Candidatus Bathyarchaeota archaeon]
MDIASVQIYALEDLGLLNTIDLYNSLQRLDDLASKYGISIGVEELSILSDIPDGEPILKKAVSEELQARLMRNFMTVMLGFPNLVRILYTTNIDGPIPREYGEIYHHSRGYLREDGSPKPAFFAIKELFDSLIYEGEYPGAPVKTLAGWYNISLYSPDGHLICTYRVHVDGGSETRIVFHLYENETIKAEVEKLKQQLGEAQEKIASLENEVQVLRQDLQSKENLITELKKRIEEMAATTVTVTTTAIIVTKTVTLQPAQPFDVKQLFLAASLIILGIAITAFIFAWKHRANRIRDKKTFSQA